jgi:membrane protein
MAAREIQGEGQMKSRASTPEPPSLMSSLGLVTVAFVARLVSKDQHASRPQIGAPKQTFASRQEPITVQLKRACEHNRGRHASSPLDIPWKGWKDILYRTASQASEDRLLAIAAGVVFYGLLALFPAIAALVSCYGLFAKPSTINDHLSFLAGVMPAEAYSIVQSQVSHVVSKGEVGLSFNFAVGLVIALWSANAGARAVMDALNIVYEEDEKRGYVWLTLVSLAFTAAGVIAMLMAVGTVVGVPLVLSRFGLADMTEAVLNAARWPALMLGMLIGLALLYRYGPSRREAKWQWISIGAVLATVMWFAGSAALSYYFANFANYNATYGSLGAAIGTMMWMWMSAIVVLFGAELNAEIEHQTAIDTTVGSTKPLGARGATMADTVGAAQAR